MAKGGPIMQNLLLKYMEQSFLKTELRPGGNFAPVVTISREYGCPSKPIGQLLADTINRRPARYDAPRWKFINKEILEAAAKELKMPEVQFNSMLGAEERGIVLDIMTFSSTYGGSAHIRKTFQKTVMSFALQGYVVIGGRGGVAITRKLPNTLHLRLQAPLEWRIREVMTHHGITERDAVKMIHKIDAKRTSLIESLHGSKFTPTLFDIIYNCETMSKEEIVSAIIQVMVHRKMI